ncbi:hypothetical protein [Spirillospora sp. NPDC029432]|uniref:hypothetical protein n=1 Tax=Spirillospora sp. NPDC029432 TaxID=3154599 RepID=UPI003452399A
MIANRRGPRTRRPPFRVIVPLAVLLLAAVAAGVALLGGGDPRPRPVPFEARRVYETGEQRRIETGGRAVTYVPAGGRTLDSRAGCLAGAGGARSRALLADVACQGRVQASFRTTGNVTVDGHVLRFKDSADAAAAGAWLAYTDLRFTGGGTARDGRVDRRGRYVVVTAGASQDPKRTADAVAALHGATLTILGPGE